MKISARSAEAFFKWKIGPEGPDFADFEQKLGIFKFFFKWKFWSSEKEVFF